MRGREAPPTQPTITSEDWAAKKRLRERYPEGDHSAMNSEVNSLDNSQENSDAEAEETERARGRERAVREEEAETRGRGRASRQRGQDDGAALAPSSLNVNKGGISAAQLSGQSGLEALPDKASQRIRDRAGKEQSAKTGAAEPLKPATKQSQPEAKPKKEKQQRKSVAFVETPEAAQAAVVEEDESTSTELPDESDSESRLMRHQPERY